MNPRNPILTCSCALALIACDAKLSSQDKTKIKIDLPDAPIEGPVAVQDPVEEAPPPIAAVEVPLGVPGARRYFQTRSVVRLGFDATLLADADRFVLRNQTTSQTIADEAMTDGHVNLQEGATLDMKAGKAMVTIYPGVSPRDQLVAYGDNSLTAGTVSGVTPRSGKMTVTLRDFPVFDGAVVLSFPDGGQTSDGLQAWVSPVRETRVGDQNAPAGTYGLTVGVHNFVND